MTINKVKKKFCSIISNRTDMSRVQITLEKLEELKFEIIKEIEEVTEGIVSEFHIDNTGMYAYFKVTYVSSLCFPKYQLLSIYFEKRRVYCCADVISFSCVRELFLSE